MNPFDEKAGPAYTSIPNPSQFSQESTAPLVAASASPPSRISHEFDNPYDFMPQPATAPNTRASAMTYNTLSDKLTLSADPNQWGVASTFNQPEPDDALHDPRQHRLYADNFFSARGFLNVGCLLLLLLAILALFVGYPVITAVQHFNNNLGAYNLGGTNASGQIPEMGHFSLIDPDTPEDAYTRKSYNGDKASYSLIFSDEFNTDGRTFYPGDDPYWEAVDLHYWQTGNLEWYDPEAIVTENGYMKITLTKQNTHDLQYQGGMISTWNKFCFTGGIVEASIVLPGANNVHGLWPAFWTMGNLGRAGYGASLEGMWPYTYDSCDVGAAPNQTINGQPAAALTNGDAKFNNELSWLPGQKLSRCVCPGESHPGPKHTDGTWVGRAAPEIDVFEAQIEDGVGAVSQSAQWAPFNHGYIWQNTSDNLIISDSTVSKLNTYTGGALQQATSVVSNTNQNCYDQGGTGCFASYGFQYKPGYDDAYITWMNNGKTAWRINAAGMAADSTVGIAARPVPQEPLYILLNLGLSESFGKIDFDSLVFPTSMKIDWVRVYQEDGKQNYGCNPKDFPTADYIAQYQEAYTNPNLTTWVDGYKQPFPKSSINGDC
ncbi:glycoside hydrolase family 16 protein [Flagelloscypha sp. PMI_526]|nr:glycoside hydrolase family 16 protein [Flagelloscypha sp. PMI_526]